MTADAGLKAEKRVLRAAMLEKRASLTSKDRKAYAKAWKQRFFEEPAVQHAKIIFAYATMPEEVPLDGLMEEALELGKRVCVPYITGKGTMEAVELTSLSDLEPGAFGIRTVKNAAEHIVPPEDLDLIIVPGAAFSPEGIRLGLGGGYYDRYLPRAAQAYRLVLACDWQIVPEVPHAPHDQLVDSILTEKQFICCPAR